MLADKTNCGRASAILTFNLNPSGSEVHILSSSRLCKRFVPTYAEQENDCCFLCDGNFVHLRVSLDLHVLGSPARGNSSASGSEGP